MGGLGPNTIGFTVEVAMGGEEAEECGAGCDGRLWGANRLSHVCKKEVGEAYALHSEQPVNADGAESEVTPEPDELLNGEDAGEIFDQTVNQGSLWTSLAKAKDLTKMAQSNDNILNKK